MTAIQEILFASEPAPAESLLAVASSEPLEVAPVDLPAGSMADTPTRTDAYHEEIGGGGWVSAVKQPEVARSSSKPTKSKRGVSPRAGMDPGVARAQDLEEIDRMLNGHPSPNDAQEVQLEFKDLAAQRRRKAAGEAISDMRIAQKLAGNDIKLQTAIIAARQQRRG
jgi:hypothetical protein